MALLGLGEAGGRDLAGQIAHQLETAITIGLLSDGERLPAEAELAAQLGVSTITLRQALALLRTKGLITTRRGRSGGSVVSHSGAVATGAVEQRLRNTSTEDLRDLGDLSTAAAAAAARLAAQRADEPDVQRLRDLCTAFEQAGDADTLRRNDSRFHIGLGVAAQSRRLTATAVQAQGELAALLWLPATGAEHAARAAREHAAIVEAIADRDPLAAQALAVEHSARDIEVVIDAHLGLLMDAPRRQAAAG